MIVGTGIDLVEISRFERFLNEGNDPLFRRLFSDDEREYCSAKKRSAQHFALRFAAKEAYVKACGCGLRDGMTWKDMEVVNDPLGKPSLRLTGQAAVKFVQLGATQCHLSMSHDGNYAVAMVVLEQI